MEKDILEVERLSLENILKEIKKEQILKINQDFRELHTYHGVSLEGKNLITLDDVKRILKTNKMLDYSERENKEVINQALAFDFVLEKAKQNQELDEELVKDIHELLVKDIFQGGVYRNVNIQIIGGVHQPPDYVKVYDRMAKLFQTAKEYKNPIEKAVYVHAMIAKIHPFLDGNGRLARLVLNFLLVKNDYLPIIIKTEDKDTYIKHLETFKVEKDMKPLLDYIKSILIKRYEEVIEALEVSA